MFYDLEDPSAFVADVASILLEEGVWVIEMHYLPMVLECNAFDAIWPEHIEYYSLSSLEPLLARHGLLVADVETNDVNGGSFRMYVVHRNSPAASVPARRERVNAMRARDCSARPHTRNSARVCGRLARSCRSGCAPNGEKGGKFRRTAHPQKETPCCKCLDWITP
jgi:hypothetical protein